MASKTITAGDVTKRRLAEATGLSGVDIEAQRKEYRDKLKKYKICSRLFRMSVDRDRNDYEALLNDPDKYMYPAAEGGNIIYSASVWYEGDFITYMVWWEKRK